MASGPAHPAMRIQIDYTRHLVHCHKLLRAEIKPQSLCGDIGPDGWAGFAIRIPEIRLPEKITFFLECEKHVQIYLGYFAPLSHRLPDADFQFYHGPVRSQCAEEVVIKPDALAPCGEAGGSSLQAQWGGRAHAAHEIALILVGRRQRIGMHAFHVVGRPAPERHASGPRPAAMPLPALDFSLVPAPAAWLAVVADAHSSEDANMTALQRNIIGQLNDSGVRTLVHLGDFTSNNRREAHAARARDIFDAFAGALYYVAGNHDSGNKPSFAFYDPGLTVTPRRNAQIMSWYGTGNHFLLERGNTAVFLLNSQIMGTGFEEDRRQWEWLDRTLRQKRGAAFTIIMLHVPPFLAHAREPGFANYDALDEDVRDRLRGLCQKYQVHWVIAGHCHRLARRCWTEQTTLLLVPSIGFPRWSWWNLRRNREVYKLGYCLIACSHAAAPRCYLVRTPEPLAVPGCRRRKRPLLRHASDVQQPRFGTSMAMVTPPEFAWAPDNLRSMHAAHPTWRGWHRYAAACWSPMPGPDPAREEWVTITLPEAAWVQTVQVLPGRKGRAPETIHVSISRNEEDWRMLSPACRDTWQVQQDMKVLRIAIQGHPPLPDGEPHPTRLLEHGIASVRRGWFEGGGIAQPPADSPCCAAELGQVRILDAHGRNLMLAMDVRIEASSYRRDRVRRTANSNHLFADEIPWQLIPMAGLGYIRLDLADMRPWFHQGSLDARIVALLKDHQKQGLRFMLDLTGWDAAELDAEARQILQECLRSFNMIAEIPGDADCGTACADTVRRIRDLSAASAAGGTHFSLLVDARDDLAAILQALRGLAAQQPDATWWLILTGEVADPIEQAKAIARIALGTMDLRVRLLPWHATGGDTGLFRFVNREEPTVPVYTMGLIQSIFHAGVRKAETQVQVCAPNAAFVESHSYLLPDDRFAVCITDMVMEEGGTFSLSCDCAAVSVYDLIDVLVETFPGGDGCIRGIPWRGHPMVILPAVIPSPMPGRADA